MPNKTVGRKSESVQLRSRENCIWHVSLPFFKGQLVWFLKSMRMCHIIEPVDVKGRFWIVERVDNRKQLYAAASGLTPVDSEGSKGAQSAQDRSLSASQETQRSEEAAKWEAELLDLHREKEKQERSHAISAGETAGLRYEEITE